MRKHRVALTATIYAAATVAAVASFMYPGAASPTTSPPQEAAAWHQPPQYPTPPLTVQLQTTEAQLVEFAGAVEAWQLQRYVASVQAAQAASARAAAQAAAIRTARSTATTSPPTPSGGNVGGIFACIRQRESGGNYAEDTGNGYYGAYQFAPGTWNTSVRGAGFPQYANGRADLAPPSVQDAAAEWLQANDGWSPWSTAGMCGA